MTPSGRHSSRGKRGSIQAFQAPPDLQALGTHIIEQIPHPVLYARVDLLPHQGHYLLMELELIEPSLFFRTHSGAAQNFRLALETIR